MLEKFWQKNTASDNTKKPSLRERFEKDRSLRIRAVLLSVVLFEIVYFLIYFSSGHSMSIAGTIPAVTVAWLFGFLPGIFAGILTFPVLLFLHSMLNTEIWDNYVAIVLATSGTGAVILCAGIVGKIRDLDIRFRKSLRERKLAEQFPVLTVSEAIADEYRKYGKHVGVALNIPYLSEVQHLTDPEDRSGLVFVVCSYART